MTVFIEIIDNRLHEIERCLEDLEEVFASDTWISEEEAQRLVAASARMQNLMVLLIGRAHED